ncbi:MAG: TetR/AcrR family transcriptional regulator [Gemmatimonadota bacterium]|nr:MAG: TetR/AcrR family transcriptional regulator [Gemmatimonadota bacterium]
MTAVPTSEADKQGSAQVEQAILDAARDLLAGGGQDALSMRQVADHVGVSATAIYHYFQGKQDLVNRVVLKAFERFGSYLREAMDSHPQGSAERFGALGEAYLRFALENEAYFRIMFSMQARDPAVLEQVPEGGGYHLLRRAVADALAAGTIRIPDSPAGDLAAPVRRGDADPDVIAMFLWCTVHGLVSLWLCGAANRCHVAAAPTVIDMYRTFIPMVAHGISARREAHDESSGEGGAP